MKKIVGYTQGTFDTLHYGHIRLLKNAKKQCDYLIVGVNSDRLVKDYKNIETIIKEDERLEIVEAIKFVDEAHIVETLDKTELLQKFNFDICFIGDDWKNSERYKKTEHDLNSVGVSMIYLPYTKGISSTYIRKKRSSSK